MAFKNPENPHKALEHSWNIHISTSAMIFSAPRLSQHFDLFSCFLASCELFGNCDNNLSHLQLENLHIMPRPYANFFPLFPFLWRQYFPGCTWRRRMQKAQICKTFCRNNCKSPSCQMDAVRGGVLLRTEPWGASRDPGSWKKLYYLLKILTSQGGLF